MLRGKRVGPDRVAGCEIFGGLVGFLLLLFDLSAQDVKREPHIILLGLPILFGNARGFFRGTGFLDAIDHASQIAACARQAFVVAALFEQIHGHEHHFRIIRMIRNEQFCIFQCAGRIIQLFAALHQSSINSRFSRRFGKSFEVLLQLADQCRAIIACFAHCTIERRIGIFRFFRSRFGRLARLWEQASSPVGKWLVRSAVAGLDSCAKDVAADKKDRRDKGEQKC